ncbi:bacterial ribosomal protein bL17 family protein [Abortiporus biennis]
MKHGLAFRKFSRTSSHRMLMLRNLVTSLIEHEQIKTTLPKARDTARLAEKLITLGKKGGIPAYQRANGFLLKTQLTPKVFGQLAERYADRVGGYTRIHKFGNRPGDNAPHAILELVDNPHDLKFEMTARAVGWDILSKRVGEASPKDLVENGINDVDEVIARERILPPKARGELRQATRWNLQKVLKFRKEDASVELQAKAEDHIDSLLAQPVAMKQVLAVKEEKDAERPLVGAKALRLKAGHILPGTVQSTLRVTQGALGKTPMTKLRWFDRRKLGIDKSSVWEQL